MVELEKLLIHNRIRIVVEDEEYAYFLTWAKENDCLWGNGRIIQPYIDKPDNTTKTIVITKNRLIHHPHGYISNMGLENTCKYYFKDISNDVIKDIRFEEQVKLRQSIEDKQRAMELEEASFEERINRQREINKRQLNYQKYIRTIPKQFFVKYNDTNELIELFNLLSKYGYENYFNINPVYFDEKPCVLHIDNRGMYFSPTNVTCCACAAMAGIKFYAYEEFVPILKNIFEKDIH